MIIDYLIVYLNKCLIQTINFRQTKKKAKIVLWIQEFGFS